MATFDPRDRRGGGDLLAQRVGHQRDPDDIAHLPLIGRHAERCVSLEMLHRHKALVMGQSNIVCRDVVLRVYEGLEFLFRRANLVEGVYGAFPIARRLRGSAVCRIPDKLHCFKRGFLSRRTACGVVPHPGCTSRGQDRLFRGWGQKARQFRVPDRLDTPV